MSGLQPENAGVVLQEEEEEVGWLVGWLVGFVGR